MQVPRQPKIYHIVHVDNLASIIASGGLVSDRAMIRWGGPVVTIGMSKLKQDRIERRPVRCHPGTMVGDYVPFYFCPRSVMLYVISRANHPELTYRDGQGLIVHLEADLLPVLEWADSQDRRWAFSSGNAAASYASFYNRREDLEQLDWAAIQSTDWRPTEVKEAKQAEFLIYEHFPWSLVTRIGVYSLPVANRASAALRSTADRPPIEVRQDWYYT